MDKELLHKSLEELDVSYILAARSGNGDWKAAVSIQHEGFAVAGVGGADRAADALVAAVEDARSRVDRLRRTLKSGPDGLQHQTLEPKGRR